MSETARDGARKDLLDDPVWCDHNDRSRARQAALNRYWGRSSEPVANWGQEVPSAAELMGRGICARGDVDEHEKRICGAYEDIGAGLVPLPSKSVPPERVVPEFPAGAYAALVGG